VPVSIVEGYHRTPELIDKAIAELGKNSLFPDYPKHFEICYSSAHMLELGEILKAVSEE
jgi:hypothetical protein